MQNRPSRFMKKQFPNKAIEIVLLCAMNGIRTVPKTKFKEVIQRDVNWDLVVKTAQKHGLGFVLYKELKQIGSELVPGNTLSKLQDSYVKNSARNFFLCVNLVKIVALLNKHKIIAIPFKGPVQSECIYKDIGLRSFSDLDILVKREDAVNARDLLLKSGFTTDINIPDGQLNKYIAEENFFTLINRAGIIIIDLHWEMTGLYSLHPLYLDDFPSFLESVKLIDKNIISLSCEYMLIQLCIHGTSHCWNKMEMVYSVAEIVKSNKIDDWNGVIKIASRLKCKRMIYLGLLLAEKMFGIALPGEIEISILNDHRIKKLSKRILQNILNEEKAYTESLSWRFSPTHFLVRDSLFDMVHYFFRLLFRPTVREWIEYPLPDSLLLLYYILRPYRLVKNGLRGKNA